MQDCLGREIKLDDEVAFSVGTTIKTGKVVRIREKNSYGRTYEVARILLTVPEMTGGRYNYLRNADNSYRRDENGSIMFEVIGAKPKLTRDCDDKSRIIIVNKALDNLDR